MTVLEELKQDLKETIIVAENELKGINDTEIRFRVNSFVKTILEKIIKEIDNEYIPKEQKQIEKSWIHGALRVPEDLRHINGPNTYYKVISK